MAGKEYLILVLFYYFSIKGNLGNPDINCKNVNLIPGKLNQLDYGSLCWFQDVNIDPKYEYWYSVMDVLYRIQDNWSDPSLKIGFTDGNRTEVLYNGTADFSFKIPQDVTGDTIQVRFEASCPLWVNVHFYLLYVKVNDDVTYETRENGTRVSIRQVRIPVRENIIMPLTTSAVIRFDSDEIYVIFEPPTNTSVIGLVFLTHTAYNKGYYPKFLNEWLSKLPLQMRAFDGPTYETSSKKLEGFDEKWSYEKKVIFGNEITVSLAKRDSEIKYSVNQTIMDVEIVVLKNELDCYFQSFDYCRGWNNFTNINKPRDWTVKSPEFHVGDTPTCLILKYKSIGNPDPRSVFKVEWIMTNKSTITLYKDYGNEKLRDGYGDLNKEMRRWPRLQLPIRSSGRIKMAFKSLGNNSNGIFDVYSTETKEGQCYDSNKYKNLDCIFKQTLCEWNMRPKGLGKFELTDTLFLYAGGLIISPKISEWGKESCLKFRFSGRCRLSVIRKMQKGINNELLAEYFFESIFDETRLINLAPILHNFNNFQLILKVNGFIKLKEEGHINIYEISMEKCIYEPSTTDISNLTWINLPEGFYGNGEVIQVDIPFSNLSYVVSTAVISKSLWKKWVCFSYKIQPIPQFFIQSPSLTVSISNNDHLAWTQCNSVYYSETEACIPLPDTFVENVRVYAEIKSVEGNKTVLSRPEKVYSTLLISTPKLQDKPQCGSGETIIALDCGWHQTSAHSLKWFYYPKTRKPETLLFSQRVTEGDEQHIKPDVMYSPPVLLGNKNDFVQVSFKLSIYINPTLLSLSIVEAQNLTRVYLNFTKFMDTGSTEFNEAFELSKDHDSVEYVKVAISFSPVNRSHWNLGVLTYLKVSPLTYLPERSIDCNFDSGSCGWKLDDSYWTQKIPVKHESSIEDLNYLPPFDAAFNSSGGYLVLISLDHNGNLNKTVAQSPYFVQNSSRKNYCVEFWYYLNGSDNLGTVELLLKVVTRQEKSENLWYQRYSQDLARSWHRVLIPVFNAKGDFSLIFETVLVLDPAAGSYVVAIDSVRVWAGKDDKDPCSLNSQESI